MQMPKISNNLYQKIDHLTVDELDQLPHGAIQLDQEGRILKFNAYESQLARLKRETVIGKNFFKDVAPCTDVQEFYGRFQKGVAEKRLLIHFRYYFAFKQDPRDVLVTLFYSDATDTVWVLVQPIS